MTHKKSAIVHTIRPMVYTDLPEIVAIQYNCYNQSYWEDLSIFSEKLHLYPAGCYVAIDSTLRIVGYVFSHPLTSGQAAPLNGPLYSLPPKCDSLYLHDCAVDPKARGFGIGEMLVCKVIDTSRISKARSIQLISVQQSKSFWERFGFVITNNSSYRTNDNLSVYGTDAVMMSMNLE